MPEQLELPLVAPDDTGSSTFSRYCYQAHLAFRYCLACGLGEQIRSVVLEHFEDFALEYEDSWRFVQVKTRDPALGPWKLRDLLSNGGAIRSLFRTFEALGDFPATYEAHLEGAARRGNPIESLRPPGGRCSPEALQQVRAALGVSEEKCRDFLERVRIVPGQPLRDSIAAENIRLLGSQASAALVVDLATMHESILGLIHAAMAAEPDLRRWSEVLNSPEGDPDRERYKRKCLTHEDLQPLVTRLRQPSQPLLRRLVLPEEVEPSQLEVKLLAGGAPQTLIDDAKQLRANAATRRFEYLSSTLSDDDAALEDVDNRLRVRANALVAQCSPGPRPAPIVWERLLTDLQQHNTSYDSRCVFARDPFLLLGEACDLADQCVIDWGVTDA